MEENLIKNLKYYLTKNIIELNDRVLTKEIKKDSSNDEPASKLLDDIKMSSLENHKQKRKLKKVFFYIVMSMYIVVILTGMSALVLIPIFCPSMVTSIVGVASAVGVIISSILKIPNIIATYLFPTGEDDLLVKLSEKTFKHVEVMNETVKNEKVTKK